MTTQDAKKGAHACSLMQTLEDFLRYGTQGMEHMRGESWGPYNGTPTDADLQHLESLASKQNEIAVQLAKKINASGSGSVATYVARFQGNQQFLRAQKQIIAVSGKKPKLILPPTIATGQALKHREGIVAVKELTTFMLSVAGGVSLCTGAKAFAIETAPIRVADRRLITAQAFVDISNKMTAAESSFLGMLCGGREVNVFKHEASAPARTNIPNWTEEKYEEIRGSISQIGAMMIMTPQIDVTKKVIKVADGVVENTTYKLTSGKTPVERTVEAVADAARLIEDE